MSNKARNAPAPWTVSPNSTLRETLTKFQPNPVEDEEKLMHVLHRLASLCKSRGVMFKGLFFDFDRNSNASPSRINPTRGGKVTKNQFERTFRLAFPNEINDADLGLLCARYSTQAGDVNFKAIHDDISEVLDPKPPPCPTSDLYLKPDATQWDHMYLNPVKKIQSKVVEKRVRLKDFFADFDNLRKGYCTQSQLKTALTCSCRTPSPCCREEFRA